MQYVLFVWDITEFIERCKHDFTGFCTGLDFSIPLGVLIAFALQVHWKPLHHLINIYIWIMRGTPLLLQLIFIYYVLPSIGIRLDRLPAAIIAFVLNYAAYFAEIFRGGDWYHS